MPFSASQVDETSQGWFGFTYRNVKYTFTRLSQGYAESPTIFSQAIMSNLSKFNPQHGSQILTYVDDILIANEEQNNCMQDTIDLLRFLGETGNKVSKTKLQCWRSEVKYLSHILTASGRKISESRKTAVLQAPKPVTKKQMMSFLGLVNYCRSWILDYAAITKPLLNMIHGAPMKMSEKLNWTMTAENSFIQIKTVLAATTVLALPDYTKPFVQTCDSREGFMTSVLMQKHGTKLRPVAYYSTQLDPVARATPCCVQTVIAAAMAVKASAEVVLYHSLKLLVPHAVHALLLQTNMSFMSPARHLSCMTLLLSQPHITVERCTTLNPATLLPHS